ncbi:helix-turn-helix domain-containing protein [Streptomyces sp. NPDC059783]|uniref:TetR/AcrR family transcriptional regulator n=1 Tax=Streptomyces sp. NPDC059783 TaxID=3346944 RepID=UPI00365EBE52
MTALGRRERMRVQMSVEVRSTVRRLIAHQGVEALTLAEVARRVGVTLAALYRHFEGGLPDIVYQVAEDIVDDLVRTLQSGRSSRSPTAASSLTGPSPTAHTKPWP